MSGIAIFNKAVSTLQDSQRNLMAISQARQKLEQENELFKLKKKKAELDLETAVKEGKMTDLQAEVLGAQNKAYIQQEQDKMKGKIALINQAQQENATVADKAMKWAKIGYKSDPQGVAGFLQAMRRNEMRTQEIRPKMSYGKIGYETVDVAEEQAKREDRASIRESRELDIKKKRKELEAGGDAGYSSQEVAIAKEIANNDPDYKATFESRLQRALPKAREALGGKIDLPSKEQSTVQSKFKAGDIREKNGIKYKRNESGQWLPLS